MPWLLSKCAYRFLISLRYRDDIKTFLVFYDRAKCQHFVGEKLFDTMELLVKDGLIHFHVEYEGADVLDEIASVSVYDTAPYRVTCVKSPGADQQCDAISDLSSQVTLPLPRPKQHSYKVHTFIGAHWCDYCNNFLWGLKSQGMKCSECGFQAHKKCSERSNAEADCLPDMKFMRRVFAVDLISLVRAENRTVPIVLEKCVTEIERRDGLHFEGLYRIPGNQDNVEELKRLFDKNADDVSLNSDARICDLNVLTSLIKMFMRQLPNPMVPYENYEDFVQVARDETLSDEVRDLKYREAVHKMPLEHYQTVKFFLAHLNRS
ncbi:Beta-chimaerin, partial [Cichlidogyrus casuarinus]